MPYTFSRLPMALAALCATGPAVASETISALPPEALVWDATPEGVAFAPLIGDRFEEAYMAMVRLPAGTVSPPHIKSANMFGIILSGTMTHVAAGSAADPVTHLSSGAFYRIPKGLTHVSSCISDQECVTFLYQDGKFDFQPVTQ